MLNPFSEEVRLRWGMVHGLAEVKVELLTGGVTGISNSREPEVDDDLKSVHGVQAEELQDMDRGPMPSTQREEAGKVLRSPYTCRSWKQRHMMQCLRVKV